MVDSTVHNGGSVTELEPTPVPMVDLLTKYIAANIDHIPQRGKSRRLARSILANLAQEGFVIVRSH